MLPLDACPICASRKLRKVPAELAPFLRIRCGLEVEPVSLSRCYCPACDFSFFDQRLDETETQNLYRDYRGRGYRELREHLEPGSNDSAYLHEDRNNEFHHTRIRQTAALLSQWGVRPNKVLDYGGEADAWLARGLFPEAEVHAYDLSLEMATPPLESFDLVLCAHVLEHVSFPLSFLNDLERYLVPGGCLYAEVPYDAVGPLSNTLLEGHPLNRMHEHISFFTPRSLCRLLAAAGMEPTHAESFRAAPYYRGIAALARKSTTPETLPTTLEDLPPLDPSEDLSAPLLSSHFEHLDNLAKRWLAEGKRAVIYPAGNFAMEILASTRMSEAVVALGDGNPSIQGKERMGKVIYSAEEILNLGAQILLIASPLHESEIAAQLTSLFRPDMRLLKASQPSTFMPFLMTREAPKPMACGVGESMPGCIGMLSTKLRQGHSSDTTRFVIVSHPRSGSYFLRGILDQHPGVLELGELLDIEPVVASRHSGLTGKELLCLDDVDSFLTSAAISKHATAVGFTLFNQASGHILSDSEAAQFALWDDLRVIFLTRRNLLKSYVSYKRAWLTGAWHVDVAGNPVQWSPGIPSDALGREIGPINVDKAKAWISETKGFLSNVEQSLHSQGKDFCTIFYEDLCLESQSRTMFEVNRILQFLKLEKLRRFTQPMSRVASSSFYQSIPNRQELVDALGYDLD